MRRYGLIGYPLGHSFSKKYFSEKFRNEKITDCSYELYPIASLDHFMDLLTENPELCGLNVTIPYKSEIMKYIHHVEDEAGEIGAVNVLKIKRKERKLIIHGFNSDISGIIKTLSHLPGGIRKALVLGTGGSSLSVKYVLKKKGIEVLQVSRTRKEGMTTYRDINANILPHYKLIINTTPLGMYPDIESKPDIPYNQLTPEHILFDLVYNPEETSFLKIGKERGCTIMGGLQMLYSQAERSWEIWNDERL